MGFQDWWWNIFVSSLVIIAAAVSEAVCVCVYIDLTRSCIQFITKTEDNALQTMHAAIFTTIVQFSWDSRWCPEANDAEIVEWQFTGQMYWPQINAVKVLKQTLQWTSTYYRAINIINSTKSSNDMNHRAKSWDSWHYNWMAKFTTRVKSCPTYGTGTWPVRAQ